ncbi:MAG: hypothetical protein HRT45_06400 [Bdellovibrionales bacterium]|nr:hypothetical protein [Bdellovibrionales bacterium]
MRVRKLVLATYVCAGLTSQLTLAAPSCSGALKDPLVSAKQVTFESEISVAALQAAAKSLVSQQQLPNMIRQAEGIRGQNEEVALKLVTDADMALTIMTMFEHMAHMQAEQVVLGSQVFSDLEVQDQIEHLANQFQPHLDPDFLINLAGAAVSTFLEGEIDTIVILARDIKAESLQQKQDEFNAHLAAKLSNTANEEILAQRSIHRDIVELFERTLREALGEQLPMGFQTTGGS